MEQAEMKFDIHAAIAGMTPRARARPTPTPEHAILRNQFYCINGNSGYAWMVEYMPSYDALPRVVRQQLQQSPYNICTKCLTTCLPWQTLGQPNADVLLMCVEIREHQIRSGRP
jgi:hypothetical protein